MLGVDTPRIDPRDFKKLLEDGISIAPYYTPDWSVTDEKDMGFALLKIFTHIQEEIINRLNRVPDKNFTAFLEMLGIKLMPAQPAKVPVTFYLSEGLSGGVYAPARTQIATEETEKHDALVFETKNGFFATSAVIEDIYCADPDEDKIFSYSENLNEKEFRFFEDKNDLQEHVLYLGHDDLFKLKGKAEINIKFTFVPDAVNDLQNLTWEYWGENEDNPELFDVSIKNNLLVLTSKGEIKETKIYGIKSFWIHCRNKHVTEKSRLPVISIIQIMEVAPASGVSITLDHGFYNFIPLDLSTEFHPFGEQPALFDTFYLASREAFSKKHANIEIDFKVEGEAEAKEKVTLSWEYWDGTVWRSLDGIDKTIDFTSDRKIVFECPEDLEETEINGEKNYWIRVRLVNGNYGQYKFVEDSKDKFWTRTPDFNPPIISSFRIKYSFKRITEGIDVQHYLVRNNREFRNFKNEINEGIDFRPFVPLPEKKPTIYLGFSDAFNKGNISIFFSILEKFYLQNARPKIQWTYWSKAHNIEEIINLNKLMFVSLEGIGIGTELLFEESFDIEIITETAIVKSYSDNEITLDRELYHKYTKSAKVYKRSFLEVNDYTEYLTKSGTVEFIGPDDQLETHKFGKKSHWLMGTLIESMKTFEAPLIKGIYPNTVWSEQVETIEEEILGSSDGEKSKSYKFIKSPVISPEIWIMEGEIIHEDEEEVRPEEDIQEIKDDTGKIIETWVRWRAVEDFFNSTPKSRHYIIDNSLGMVQFGDGKNGMIPPIGKDNIRTIYKSGGGVVGNVLKNEITVLKTSIAGIDHVMNHEPAEGGSDTELLEEVLERGPHLIKHRGRAVTKEDFERLAKAASSYIARTKCVTEDGKVKVIIIPKGKEDKPQPSFGLIQIVENYLHQLSLNSILTESLEVKGPSYKEVKVRVDVVPESIDQTISLEKEIRKQLKAYLHPLTGGNEKNGWEFGRGVHISDVYALLEGIKDVDHVENLELNDNKDVYVGEAQTVCSGEHKITMKLGS